MYTHLFQFKNLSNPAELFDSFINLGWCIVLSDPAKYLEKTGTDSLSWKDKSWVIGVKAGKEAKAYDWNQLKAKRMITDKIGEIPVLLVVAKDNESFFAFERPDHINAFFLQRDTLLYRSRFFRIDGKGIDTAFSLKPLHASQEFWHSWRTFYPNTTKY